jgi:hypothetical protein
MTVDISDPPVGCMGGLSMLGDAQCVCVGCNADAEVAEEQVLLAVSRAESRVQVSAVGFRGAIFAGQRQWLGICLRPWHDTLGNATLQVIFTPSRLFYLTTISPLTKNQRVSSISFLIYPNGAALHVGFQIGTSHRPSGSSFPTSITLPKRSCHATVVPLDGPAEGEGAGRAEQQQVEGTLVRISGGTLKLPAWTARQPSLVWIWVTAGEPDLPAKVQHAIYPLYPHLGLWFAWALLTQALTRLVPVAQTIRMSNEATGPRRLQHQPMASMPRIATLGRVPSRQHSTVSLRIGAT